MKTSTVVTDYANKDGNFMKIIITSDERWKNGFIVETKMQSLQWVVKDSPGSKKARQVKSNMKIMLTAFFSHMCIM